MYPAGDDVVGSRFITLPSGERIFVAECGPVDGIPVLLCHGWAACVYGWSGTLPVLAAAGYRAIAVDLRGHGRSDGHDPATSYTTAAMTAQLASIIDALALDRPVLAGHSMSGRLTLQYALDHPDRVRGLGLLAPIGVGSLRPTIKRFGQPFLALGAWLGPLSVRRWIVKLVVSAATGRLRRPPPRDIDEYWAPSQWGKYCRAIHALLRDFDWRALGADRIASLRMPTVIVLGQLDPLVVIADREALVRGVAPKLVVTIEGAGHIVIDEATARVNAELLALLALVASGD
ncbi:MAG: alpha/beta fold hydrolase [Gemmatimonadaceae bacterium]